VIRIEEINNSNFPFSEWNTLLYDAWDNFQNPGPITKEEHQFAKSFVESMSIDPEDECLVEFRAAPYHFFCLAVNAYRRMKHPKS